MHAYTAGRMAHHHRSDLEREAQVQREVRTLKRRPDAWRTPRPSPLPGRLTRVLRRLLPYRPSKVLTPVSLLPPPTHSPGGAR